MLQIEKTCKEIQKKNRVRIRGIRKSSFVGGYGVKMVILKDECGKGSAHERPINHNYNYSLSWWYLRGIWLLGNF